MLCNVYVRKSTLELRKLGINGDSPIFFINLTPQSIHNLKKLEKKGEFEVYHIQNDPYLKSMSRTWINRGVLIPEVKIVEKIIRPEPIRIEQTVEVIKEVPIEKFALIEEDDDSATDQESDGILIDTKVAFDDWKTKNLSVLVNNDPSEGIAVGINETPVKKDAVEEVVSDLLDVPEAVVDPLKEDPDAMPIPLEAEVTVEITEEPNGDTVGTPGGIRPKPKKRRRRKTPTDGAEVTVKLTKQEVELYRDTEVED